MSAMHKAAEAELQNDVDLPPFLRQLLDSVAGKQLVKRATEAAEGWFFGLFAKNRDKTAFKRKIKVFGVTVGTVTIKVHDIEDFVRTLVNEQRVDEQEAPIV